MKNLQFRLRVMMAERNIRSATELARLLRDQGVDVSSSHLTRFLKDTPPPLPVPFLSALCRVLQCNPSDLFRWIDDDGVERGTDGPASSTQQGSFEAAKTTARDETKVGPRIRALPRPGLA